MRREFDRRPQRLKAVLTDDGVRKEFLNGVPKSDAKAVKAFVSSNSENALKTKPKVSALSFSRGSLQRGLLLPLNAQRCFAFCDVEADRYGVSAA